MPDNNANLLLAKLQQQQQQQPEEGAHDAGKLLDEAVADAAKREQLLMQMLASMSGGGIMANLIGAIKSPWYAGLTPGGPNSLTRPSAPGELPGGGGGGTGTSDSVTPRGGYGGGGYKGGGGSYGGGGASGDYQQGPPIARARTPWHDSHPGISSGGRGRTPWHSSHPGISSSQYPGEAGAGGGAGGTGGRGASIGWWTADRQQHAVNYLMKNGGLSEIGAKGLVARWAYVEAQGGPGEVNKIGATGIGQWLGARKQGVVVGDFEGQLAHAVKELQGSEKSAGNVLRNAKTADEAARGASMFERAEGYNSRTGRDNFTGRTAQNIPRISGGTSAPSTGDYGASSGRGGGFGRGGGDSTTPGGGGGGGAIAAQTSEQRHGTAAVHGSMTVGGETFNFVSGGRGRGSAPFGQYEIDEYKKVALPTYGLPGYHISDKFDPLIQDKRSGLFIHPGNNASAGCIAIPKDQWDRFTAAMKRDGRHSLILGPQGERVEQPVQRGNSHEARIQEFQESRVEGGFGARKQSVAPVPQQTGPGRSDRLDRTPQRQAPAEGPGVSGPYGGGGETTVEKKGGGQTSAERQKQVAPSSTVLRTNSGLGQGTAFHVGDGYYFSDSHNFALTAKQTDLVFNGQTVKADIIHNAPDTDFAILRTSKESTTGLQKGGMGTLPISTATPEVKDALTAHGLPGRTGTYSTVKGSYVGMSDPVMLGRHDRPTPIGREYDITTGNTRDKTWTQGMSGGPITDAQGRAVGTMTGLQANNDVTSMPMGRALAGVQEGTLPESILAQTRQKGVSPTGYTTEDAVKDLHRQNEEFKKNIEKKIEEQKKGEGKPAAEGGRPEDVKIHPSDSHATRMIKRFEAFSSKSYPDKGQTSIGYGSKAREGEKTITEEEASKRVGEEMSPITSWLDSNVTAKMTENQRAGLTSFAYNEGTGALDRLKGDINSGNWDNVYKRMATWNKVTEGGKKVFSKGIYARRLREIELMATPDGKVPKDFAFGEKGFGTMGLPGASKVKNLKLPYDVQDKVDPFDKGAKATAGKHHAAHVGRRHAQSSRHPGAHRRAHAAPHHPGGGHAVRHHHPGAHAPSQRHHEAQVASGDGGTLVFLHGIHDRYAGSDEGRNAKKDEIEKSVREYATAHGYKDVKFISGKLSQEQQQTELSNMIQNDKSVSGVFGFSRGGYSAYRALNALPEEHRGRIKQAIILGAPGTGDVNGVPTVNRGDMEGGHMNMVQNWTRNQGTETGKPRPGGGGGAEDVSSIGGRQVRSSSGRMVTTTPGDEWLASRTHIGGLSRRGASKEGFSASDIDLNYAVRSMKPEMRYALHQAMQAFEKEKGHGVSLASTYRSAKGPSSGLSSAKGSQHGKGYAADVGGKTWGSVPAHGQEFLHYIDQHPEFGLSAKGLHGFKVPYGKGKSGPDVGHIEFSGSRGGAWATWSPEQKAQFYKGYKEWMSSTPQPTEHPVTGEKKDQSRLTPEVTPTVFQRTNKQIQDSAARHGALHQPPPPPTDTQNKNPTVRNTGHTQHQPHEKRNTNITPDWTHHHRQPSAGASSRVVNAFKKSSDLRHDSFSTAGDSNA